MNTKFKITGLALALVLALGMSQSTTAEILPTVSTDKTKYEVGEPIVISGTNFSADAEILITIDLPGNKGQDTGTVQSVIDGSFSYNYQPPMLPGRYKIHATDGTNSARTAVTEADAVATDISQCQNGGVGDPLQPCSETAPFAASTGYGYEGNAAANSGNSHWTEGDFVPLRIVGTGYSAGAGNIQFSIDVTKGGKHAYDYVGSFDATETTGAASASHANRNNPCGDIIVGCDPANPNSQGVIPAAALAPFPVACGSNTFIGTQVGGNIKAWGTSGDLTVTYISQNVGSSDCTTVIQVAWTATQPGFGGTIVIGYGAHIAKQSDWGTGNSAINISGSPYHSSLVQRTTGGETKGIGNQDAKLSASAIVVPSTITIRKATSPAGGTGFNYTTTGGLSPSTFNLNDGGSQVFSPAPGSYTVTETSPGPTYALTNLSCTSSGTGTSATTNLGTRTINITIGSGGGGNVDCTYTNTLQTATLTLVKTVTNDNGGTAQVTDWTLSANGPTPISGTSGSGAVTNAAVNAGNYTLSESGGPSNYTAGNWSCTNGVTVTSSQITLAPGQSTTCTINNNDNGPTLKLVKTVTNDNGGTAQPSAWTLTASGTGGFSDAGNSTTFHPVNAGVGYALSESSVSGYTAGNWSCDGGNLQGSTVTLSLGQNVTCTINNNDVAPQLTVIKHVINDNGGTATAGNFTMNVSATNPSQASFAGSEAPGTTITLNAGSYSADESAFAGYTKTIGANCSGTIAVGESKTCTITNDDNAPSLTLVKQVANNHGGTAVAANWTLSANGPTPISGAGGATSNASFDAGTYSLSESTGPSGYTAGVWVCVGGSQNGSDITIGLGESATCTIINSDVAPQLTVIKHVINDNGGSAVAGDFTMNVSATNPSDASFPGAEAPGTTITLDAGSYDVTESGPSGYTASFSANCSGTIAVGETKTCTVTNDDQAAKLIVIKHVINDNGGTAVAADFTLDSGGSNDTPDNFPGAEAPGVEVTLDAGSYNVTESGPAGYTASFSADCSGSIANGQTKTCTVTNDDQAAKLIVIKHVINDNGGTAAAADFTLDSGGSNDTPDNFPGAEAPGTEVTLNAGSYSVSESGPSGYAASYSADCTGTIANGQTKTCTVTNDDIAPQLIVIKHVINDNGGTSTAANFTLDAGGSNDSPDNFPGQEAPGTTVTLDAGGYNVTESGPSGYAATFSADCNGTIAVGETKTCTVTNDDIAPTLTLVKTVSNTHGGNAVENDFQGKIDNSNVPWGVAQVVNAGVHTASETTLPGYTAGSWGGACSAGGNVSLAPGENKTCSITNSDQTANIVLIKQVINDNGGTAGPNDFGLTVGGNPVASGSTTPVNSNTPIALNEAGLSGYQFVSITGDQKCPQVLGGSVTLDEGETVTCTITNNDEPGQLKIVKNTIGANGTFDFTVTGPSATSTSITTSGNTGTTGFFNVNAGSYSVSETVPATWDLTSATCTSGTPANFTVVNGGQVTCTFTDTKIFALEVTKTAETTFTRTHNWTIDKSVSTSTLDIFNGDSGTVTYTVAVTKASSTDSNWAASGSITIINPNTTLNATITSVSDLADAVNLPVNCAVSFPYVLAPGASLICTYIGGLPDGTNRTNTATVVTSGLVPGGSGTAPVTFGAPTTVVNNSVNVTDTNGSSWQFGDTGSVNYNKTFTCDADEGLHNNTATITETGQSDSASVRVNCYDLTVTKNAATSFTRTYGWNINKTGDQTSVTLSPGQVFPVNYTVTVNNTGYTDSAWAASGSITVNNPAPIAATLNSVSDVISGGVNATVNCGVSFPYVLAAGGSLNCTYTASLSDATTRTNTATAVLQNTPSGTTDYSGSANVSFAGATITQVDESITVTDTLQGNLGTVSIGDTLPKLYTYTRNVGPYEMSQCGVPATVDNTATFTTNDSGATGSDSHTVNVSVQCVCSLTQGYWKTHNNSFKGGAPADDNWSNLPGGLKENTIFFLSGQTWFNVFWTAPKGNVYYNLAHQYMAAKLNVLNGASGPGIAAAITQVETLFSTYTPAQIAALKNKSADKTLSQQFTTLAGILGAFNEGLTNPSGHCSEIPQ